MVELTSRAVKFLQRNLQFPVVACEWLLEDGRPAEGPPEKWTKCRFKFSDKSRMTLRDRDMESLRRAGIEQRWEQRR